MKKTLSFLFLFAMLFFTKVNAQDGDPGPGSVTVYAEDGENFTLYLNGERINASPTTRVVANNVKEVPVAFRIVLEKNGSEIKKNGIRQGTNCLYAVGKNKKGEHVLKMKDCSNEPLSNQGQSTSENVTSTSSQTTETTTVIKSTPAQLSATYTNGIISINDGRTLTVKKVKVNGMTYPRVFMDAPSGAKVNIAFDGNNEKFDAEVPFKYEVKDFENNNNYFTLTVNEGGPTKTWHVKLQHANGYDLKIE
jgi:hypothetical protein